MTPVWEEVPRYNNFNARYYRASFAEIVRM